MALANHIKKFQENQERGIINLNTLSKHEFETVMNFAKEYKKPTLEDIILDLKESIHDFNREDIERIIRKLRESKITKIKDLR